jgi:hypothetical protein
MAEMESAGAFLVEDGTLKSAARLQFRLAYLE